MPIYEYECGACGHYLEALQKVEESTLRKCPECGRLKLQRLLSAPRFRLKGGGWYETDFKKDKQRNLAGRPDKPAEAGEKTATTEKSATNGDKPAGKGTKPDKENNKKTKASGQVAA